MSNPNLNISIEDIEKMRDIVLAHDKQQPGNVVHDINKPPVANYAYQPFPKMVFAPHYDRNAHSHPDSNPQEVKDMVLIVKSPEELELALAKGWLAKPPMPEVEVAEVAEPEAGIPAPKVPKKPKASKK